MSNYPDTVKDSDFDEPKQAIWKDTGESIYCERCDREDVRTNDNLICRNCFDPENDSEDRI